ncbi:beta-defensin 135 isoform X3 [Equus caballus]|uniref:beta-defensin 135 isoform X3 n=1 Tax=Equus caballus TaxID=9796 RepID=UPI0038B37258
MPQVLSLALHSALTSQSGPLRHAVLPPGHKILIQVKIRYAVLYLSLRCAVSSFLSPSLGIPPSFLKRGKKELWYVIRQIT